MVSSATGGAVQDPVRGFGNKNMGGNGIPNIHKKRPRRTEPIDGDLVFSPPTQMADEIENQMALPAKKWIARYEKIQTIQQRKRVLKWLLVIFTGTLLGVFAIFILDGFKIAGFTLPESVLNKLALLTIGQVAGLAAIALRFLFH
jgi:hypothetical protein